MTFSTKAFQRQVEQPMFKTLLTQQQIDDIGGQEREIQRLHALSNLWLGYALMRLCRQARASQPGVCAEDFTYDATLVWYLIPELARRLGYRQISIPEIDWELRLLPPYALRVRAGACLKHLASWGTHCPAWSLLNRSPCNGNPVGMAADRLWRGDVRDRDDYIAQSTHEVCGHRRVAFDGVWTPGLLQSARSHDIAELGHTG